MENKNVSLEEIKKIFQELFYGSLPKEDQEYVEKFETNELDLLDQILNGYTYQIDSGKGPVEEGRRRVIAMTGSGGVKEYIKACRKEGLPDSLTIQSISVFVGGDYYPLWTARKTILNGK